ncbi:MAG: biotin--[acetyl-CoA-carboxylase] ligase [Flavobacteriales bacterium Tduv]
MQKLFFSVHLIHLDEVNSTNDFLNKTIPIPKDWTIVWTTHQTHGRGAGGNIWQTERGQNLTFSVALKAKIKTQEFFLLNMMVCNAIHKMILSHNNDVWIKWPNDIILMDKKICGILIENRVRKQELATSIIGIGLNVHQTHFNSFSKASSLKKLLGKEFDLQDLLIDIIGNIQNEYLLFKNHEKGVIQDHYLKHLYKKNEVSSFQIERKICNGIIRDLTKDGRLIVTMEDQSLRVFSHKEIELHY